MKVRFLLTISVVAVVSTLINGCVLALGNRVPPPEKATLGRQLTDLKQARDSGAITEEEYQIVRKRLIEGK